MCEGHMDARVQLGNGHGGTQRQTQIRKKLMKPIQNRCCLRDMAETVAGYADDEVRGSAHQFRF